jgi:GH25 family lysozyme M1 (1,4-beta-N-acetylmuramidase)
MRRAPSVVPRRTSTFRAEIPSTSTARRAGRRHLRSAAFDFALAELRRGVAAAYGRDPILYVTTEFFDAYLTNAGLDSDFWIRNVFRRPALATKRPWTFWQFANRGHVDGIDEVVDLNVFRGDEAQFAAFVRGTAPL